MSCEVCKGKNTRGSGGVLECVICKTVVHEKCLGLTSQALTVVIQNRSTYKCNKCKSARRASITGEPTIASLNITVQDLSSYVHRQFEDLLKELRQENQELRKRQSELEEKNAQSEERIRHLEERVSGLCVEADNRMQRENSTVIEIHNVPDEMIQQNKVKLASDIMVDALEIEVTASEIVNANLIAFGPEKKRNMLLVKLSSEDVRRRIIAARREKNRANNYKGIFLNKSHQNEVRITINERLTARRRELLKAAREWRTKLNFKFAWVDEGIVKMRRAEGERVFIINTFSDFQNLTK